MLSGQITLHVRTVVRGRQSGQDSDRLLPHSIPSSISWLKTTMSVHFAYECANWSPCAGYGSSLRHAASAGACSAAGGSDSWRTLSQHCTRVPAPGWVVRPSRLSAGQASGLLAHSLSTGLPGLP